jgi:Tol biopolymer transport system component
LSAAVLAPIALLGGAGSVHSDVQSRATIAYSSDGRILTIAADGSDRQHLSGPELPRGLESAVGDDGPQWSPDGSTIAYTRTVRLAGETISQAYLMHADGGAQRALTPTSATRQFAYPAWSPDGKTLVATEYDVDQDTNDFTSSIVVMGLDASVQRTLASTRFTDRHMVSLGEPAWSPDGSTVVFTRATSAVNGGDTSALYVVPATGGTPRLLTGNGQSPDWSPDGSKIAFVTFPNRDSPGRGVISVINADGGNRVDLTAKRADASAPRWSPDGQWIAFASNRNYPYNFDHFEIYSMRADGSCVTWLTNGSAIEDEPDWRPGSGPSDPGGCGAVPRPPLVETQISAAVRHGHPEGYWLGNATGGMMLSEFRGPAYGYGPSFTYNDCEFFDLSQCPAQVEVGTGPTCRGRLLFDPIGRAQAIRKQRGALMIRYHATDPTAYLFTGTQTISVHADYFPVTRAQPIILRRIERALGELYRVSGETGPRPLAPPMIPRTVMMKVTAVDRAYRRLHNLERVRRELRLTRTAAKGRLKLARVLHQFGRIRTLNC